MLLRSLHAAPSLLIALLTASGCGSWADAPTLSETRRLLSTSASTASDAPPPSLASETHCPSGSTQTPRAGGALWLKNRAGAQISAVARDALQRVWLTQSGTQTALLSPEGEPLWSRPFGALVALARSHATPPGEGTQAYVAGSFSGALSLGPFALSARGERDVYVARVSDAGDVLAAFAVGGSEDDDITSLVVDADDNVVVSGPGIGTERLGATGEVTWHKPFWGSVALDSTGALLLTTALRGEQDFGGGTLQSQGGADVALVKLSSAGAHLFSRSFGDAGEQTGQVIAVDGEDNVLVGGTFDGTLDFGVGPLQKPADACASDAPCTTFGFLTKLDAQGSPLWSISLGPMNELSGAVTTAGAVILSGATPGGVRPFRHPWLAGFAPDGQARFRRAEWPATGVGGGRALSSAACDSLIWGVSARPNFEEEEQSYVASIGL